MERLGEHLRLGVVPDPGHVIERLREGEELAEGVPPEMSLFQELLDVLGGRAAGARLEEGATIHERHDGEHLRAGAELEDREQVRVEVAEHVAGHRDRVLAGPHPLQREARGLGDGHDADVEPAGVVVFEVPGHLLDELVIVGPVLVEPEHRGRTGDPRAGDRELHPVPDRRVLHLTGTPDIALLHRVLDERLALLVDDAHRAGRRDQEGLVVGAVLLGLLRHQPDVGHGAHGPRVERAVLLTVLDGLVIQGRIAMVRNDGFRVVKFAVRTPYLAGIADHRGDRGVDDHVARHVQVGDPLVGVHHRQGGPPRVARLDVGFDLLPLGRRQALDLRVQVPQAIVRIDADLLEDRRMLVEDLPEESPHGIAEDDRIGDLHHRGLEVDGEEHAALLGVLHLLIEEVHQRRLAHERAVDHLAGLEGELVLQDRDAALLVDELDPNGGRLVDGHRLLVRREIAAAHGGDVRLRVRPPWAHPVRMLPRVFLHRGGGPSVGVAFPQHRVHGASQHLRVARLDRLLRGARRILGIVRHLVALRLQLSDRGLELRDRRADVRQLDDVGFGPLRQLAQLRQPVRYSLGRGQAFRETGENSSRQGDIRRFDGDAGASGEFPDDRQQRVGGQRGRFVDLCPDDLPCSRCHSVASLWRCAWHSIVTATGSDVM